MTYKPILLILLLLSTINYGVCQGVQFKCFVKSVCNSNITLIHDYSLQSKDTIYHAHSGVCLIQKPGDYIFYSQQVALDIKPIIFQFSSVEEAFRYDTIQNPVLYPVLVVEYNKRSNLKTGDWLYCLTKAEGYKTDYYLNGQKRLEGLFKKGKPIGKLIFYSNDGSLKYIEYYNRHGKKITKT